MSIVKAIATGPDSWDFYQIERDVFLASVRLDDFDFEKKTCRFTLELGEGHLLEKLEVLRFLATETIFGRQLLQLKTSVPLLETSVHQIFEAAGFLPGREFGVGKKRALRYTYDRYDFIRNIAETLMGEHLNLETWSFGFDSAKKRLGVCKYSEHLISLSRYFVDLHSLDEIDQVLRHEIAHALAGPKAGHGPKWKKLATELGYNHKRISGDEIGNATAKLIGTCPNGHLVYRHRKPKSPLSCSRCAPRFDKRYLINWTAR